MKEGAIRTAGLVYLNHSPAECDAYNRYELIIVLFKSVCEDFFGGLIRSRMFVQFVLRRAHFISGTFFYCPLPSHNALTRKQ